MPKKNFPPPPNHGGGTGQNRGILELDRFNEESLHQWQQLSNDLDRLQAILFFGLEPARRALRAELLEALQKQDGVGVDLANWVRVVTYQYSNEPLSCAGSLHGYGGRFNAGIDLDAHTLDPWPALYLASDYPTAFREKFQIEHDGKIDGLSAQELALEHGASHATVFLRGKVTKVFDMTRHAPLDEVGRILSRIKMPEEARRYMKRLRLSPGALFMVKNGKQIHDMVVDQNWRVLPAQFGLPSQSHVMAELIRAAGFEGILYQSTKGTGQCLAIFPETMDGGSFVELRDNPLPGTQCTRLDGDTSELLAGWDSLPTNYRHRLA